MYVCVCVFACVCVSVCACMRAWAHTYDANVIEHIRRSDDYSSKWVLSCPPLFFLNLESKMKSLGLWTRDASCWAVLEALCYMNIQYGVHTAMKKV